MKVVQDFLCPQIALILQPTKYIFNLFNASLMG
jgi:hypothetical protein